VNPLATTGAAAHVLVADVASDQLPDREHHHLSRVLRLRPGTLISLGDGQGQWRLVRLESGGSVEPAGDVETVDRPDRPLAVAFALTKGDKPDLVVQKLTEIGIDDIVIFSARRSVVKWESDRVDAALDRLRRVADAAVQQCRRAWSPTVSYHLRVTELIGRSGVTRAECGGRSVTRGDRMIVVGPEGGWDPADGVDAVESVGFSENVLRAETAALAAGLALVAANRFQ
jgi:16S rRNA (uracil1498-N3)-methyltransferase